MELDKLNKRHRKKSTVSKISFLLFCGLCLFFFTLFTCLGIWQLQRLAWKEDLIARIEARRFLAPVAPPSRDQWAHVTASSHEYLPVRLNGRFLHDAEVLVTTVTDYGAGYWLLTPLQSSDGTVTFINRGFVPMDRREASSRQMGQIEGDTEVSGLLRLSERGGFFPRRNDAAKDRWYSRQLPAMAAARGLGDVAPYFIDADKQDNAGGIPIGGLTVVQFRNTHLSYAITWFVLSLGVGAAFIFLLWSRRKGT